mgnify:CR=1 FL=1
MGKVPMRGCFAIGLMDVRRQRQILELDVHENCPSAAKFIFILYTSPQFLFILENILIFLPEYRFLYNI